MDEQTANKNFKIKIGEFEGPLELLLDLIEKRKLHINDVSLSQVADEYIEHIKSFEDFPVSDSADFILIASTLLLIKSKSLLPNLQFSEEEKVSIEDLERRLAIYKNYKEFSLVLGKMSREPLYFAKEKRKTFVVFSPTKEISLESIKNSFIEALKNIPKQIEELPKVVVAKIISLEEMMENLSKRMQEGIRASFKEFAGIGKAEKVNVIVSFLAMLELVKQGIIRVSQDNHFDDINIENERVDIPRYIN